MHSPKTLRERLIGKPLIGFDTRPAAPRALVGQTEIKAPKTMVGALEVKAPAAMVGVLEAPRAMVGEASADPAD